MPTLEELKAEILSDPAYSTLTAAQWNAKCKFRGVDHKFEHQIKAAMLDYVRELSKPWQVFVAQPEASLTNAEILGKLARGETLDIPKYEEIIQQYREEIKHEYDHRQRCRDKLITCVVELELRKSGAQRVLHGTEYYIDFVGGDDANDGLTTGAAWKTLNKYTTVTVRTAGDIAWVRANKTLTQNAADITFDESGTTAAYIEIRGCRKEATQAGYDKWSDDSDVLPIIDFADADYQALLDKNYWKIENIEFRQSADGNGQLRVSTVTGVYIKNCTFNDGGGSGVEGLYNYASSLSVENCTFVDCWGSSFHSYAGYAKIVNCTFNKGAVRGTTYGIYADRSIVEVSDSSFGQTTAFATNDVYVSYVGRVYLRNCPTNSSYAVANMGRIWIEDEDGVYGVHQAYGEAGTRTRDTSITRPGGASGSLKLAPITGCTTNFLLWPRHEDLSGTFQLYAEAGIQKTVTIYIKGYGWSTFPTASQLYCQAEYLSNASTAARTTVTSTEVIADNTTWVPFTMTFTPARSGIVYVHVKLGLFTTSCGVNVDVPADMNAWSLGLPLPMHYVESSPFFRTRRYIE